MIPTAADPLTIAAAAGFAAYLMLRAGVGKKQLTLRGKTCPVCHHPQALCTCRWR